MVVPDIIHRLQLSNLLAAREIMQIHHVTYNTQKAPFAGLTCRKGLCYV